AGEHIIGFDAEMLGHLAHRRRPTEFGRKILATAPHRQVQLLRATRYFHGPCRVPKVPFDLAFDGATSKGGEGEPQRWVETINRFDEGQHRYLFDVVARLLGVTRGDVDRKAQMPFDK